MPEDLDTRLGPVCTVARRSRNATRVCVGPSQCAGRDLVSMAAGGPGTCCSIIQKWGDSLGAQPGGPPQRQGPGLPCRCLKYGICRAQRPLCVGSQRRSAMSEDSDSARLLVAERVAPCLSVGGSRGPCRGLLSEPPPPHGARTVMGRWGWVFRVLGPPSHEVF